MLPAEVWARMDVESSLIPSGPSDAESPSGNTPQHILHIPRDGDLIAIPGSWLGLPVGWPGTAQGRVGAATGLLRLLSLAEQLASPDCPWQRPDDRKCQLCSQTCCGDKDLGGTVQVHADIQVFVQQTLIEALQCGQPLGAHQ